VIVKNNSHLYREIDLIMATFSMRLLLVLLCTSLCYGLGDLTEIQVTAYDGIKIDAFSIDPKPTSSNGKNPTLIFISSWSLNKWEYRAPAEYYASKGYTVVSYTARGFWRSGGVIELGGTKDQADVSSMIDWVIANTNADPERIGLTGISYGT
jgi:dipeptidyl aminopeptidase/acylaminoacyl peptidase